MSLPSKELPDAALDALVEQERRRVVAPLTEWRTLSLQLKQEGLVRHAEEGSYTGIATGTLTSQSARAGRDTVVSPQTLPTVAPTVRRVHWAMRAVASVVLLGAGMLIGRSWSAGDSNGLLNQTASGGHSFPEAELASNNAGAPGLVFPDQIGDEDVITREFSSMSEAMLIMNRAQNDYAQAAAYLTVHNQNLNATPNLPNLQERLVVLDAVVAAVQIAVRELPNDPVLKQYYVSSEGARKATLQLVNQNLPSGARLAGY